MKKCSSRGPRRLQKKSVPSSWPPTFHVYHYLTLSCTLIFALGRTNLRIKRRCFMAGIHFHFCRKMIYLVALINATEDLVSIYLILSEIMGKNVSARICFNPISIINTEL